MKRSSLSAIISVTIIVLLLITGSAFGEDALYIDEDGNVGIGTTTPSQKLTIEGTGTGTNPNGLQIRYTTNENYAGNLSFKTLQLGNNGLNYIVAGNTTTGGNLRFVVNNTNNLAGTTYVPNGTTAMTITSAGKVGIGTTNPIDLLRIKSTTDDARAIIDGASGYDAELKFWENGSSKYTVGYDDATGYFVIGAINVDHPLVTVNSSGDGDFAGDLTADSYNDHTPYYEGDALTEIAKISGKDGEIDHSTLPDFAHKTAEVPTFEEVVLTEISAEDAFETVEVEKEKVQIGTQKESKGFKAIDGEIVQVVEEIPIYETETVQVMQLKKDVYLDEKTGKVYQMQGDGEVFEKDGKIYQQNQTGITIEDQRDLGAMISILTVAIQQQQKEIEELKSLLNKKN